MSDPRMIPKLRSLLLNRFRHVTAGGRSKGRGQHTATPTMQSHLGTRHSNKRTSSWCLLDSKASSTSKVDWVYVSTWCTVGVILRARLTVKEIELHQNFFVAFSRKEEPQIRFQ